MTDFPHLVCLDLPCLITTSDAARREALDRALRRLGVEPGSARHAAALSSVPHWPGTAARQAFLRVFGSEVWADAAAAAYDDAFGSCAARAGVHLTAGATELVVNLRARAALVCITTEFSAGTREALLDVLVWPELVAALVSAEPHGPDGDNVVRLALGRLGIPPVDAAVLSGSASGVAAGAAAQVARVVGIDGTGDAADELWAAGAQHVASLADVAGQTRPVDLVVA